MAKVIRARVDLEMLGVGHFGPPAGLASISVDEGSVREFELATGTTDEAINFAHVTTVTVFGIYSDQTITYEIDGNTDEHTVTAGGFHVYFNTSMTALTISNASGSTANIRLILGGS